MIITHLKVQNETSEITGVVREPDPAWSYKRADDMVVKWAVESEDWHIPYLVKRFRISAFNVDTNEHEFEEYWIDPIDGEEVKPEYVTREKTTRVAGINHVECTAWLTADEMTWITPKGELPSTADYKRTVSVLFQGVKILLRGVWSGRVLEQQDDLVHIELHVDKVDQVE